MKHCVERPAATARRPGHRGVGAQRPSAAAALERGRSAGPPPEHRGCGHVCLISADVGACPALLTMLAPCTHALGRSGGSGDTEAVPRLADRSVEFEARVALRSSNWMHRGRGSCSAGRSQFGDGDAPAMKPAERDRHRRQRAAHEQPGGGAEGEGEDGVAAAARSRARAKLPAPNRSWLTMSSGLNHHVAIRLSNPAATKLASPTRPSLTTSQRRRLTLCVQARRNVPVSSSWAMSGAPQNIPMSAGTTRTSAVTRELQPRGTWRPDGVVAGRALSAGRLTGGDRRVVDADEVGPGDERARRRRRRGRRSRPSPGSGTGATTKAIIGPRPAW